MFFSEYFILFWILLCTAFALHHNRGPGYISSPQSSCISEGFGINGAKMAVLSCVLCFI